MNEAVLDTDLAKPAELGGGATQGVRESVPLPKRNAPRGMLPLSWINRTLRVEYADAWGSGQETSGVLLDFYPTGVVLNVRGARTLIAWDRLCVAELVED